MASSPPINRWIAFIAVSIGLVLSITWTCLSAMGIACYNCNMAMPSYENNFMITTLIKLYFQGPDCQIVESIPGYEDKITENLTKPHQINGWMVTILTLSLMHIVLSSYVFYHRCADDRRMKGIIKIWCFLSLVILVVDLALAGVFIIDYFDLKNRDATSKAEKDISTIPLALFFVSAKGFALWLMYLIYVLWLCYWSFSGTPIEEQPSKMKANSPSPYMMAYDNYNFKNSREFLVNAENQKAQVEVHQPPSILRKNSTESMEAVTPFNVEGQITRTHVCGRHHKNPKSNRSSDLYDCNCYNPQESPSMGQRYGNPSHFQGSHYQGQGSSQLQRELQMKLETIRSKNERPSPPRVPDFSHNIKNFQQGGGGQEKALPPKLGRPVPPVSLPHHPATTPASRLPSRIQ